MSDLQARPPEEWKDDLRKLRAIVHLDLSASILVTAVSHMAQRHLAEPVTEEECLDVLDQVVGELIRQDPQRKSIAGLHRALGLSYGAATKALARRKAAKEG